MLLPELQKATIAARSTQCVSNVRQITLGLLNYAHDYNNQLPLATGETTRINTLRQKNYLLNLQVLICPVTKGAGSAGLVHLSQGSGYTCYYSAYYIVRTAWHLQSGPYVATPSRLTDAGANKIPVVWDQRADQNDPMNLHKPGAKQPGGVFGYLDGSASYIFSPASVIREK